jgi:hypothetical protein
MEIAEESGLRIATLASIRLRPIRMASIASGMPWPRMRSDPYRAIRPMMSPPTIGTRTATNPRSWPAGDAGTAATRW